MSLGRSMGWGSGTRAMNRGNNSQYISTLQAADALGVSVSTIKRWVDEDILPAHRTAGGHRKLMRAEVLALARQGEMPHGDLAVPSTASHRERTPDVKMAATALFDALLCGQGAEVTAIIRHAYDSGIAVEAIADKIIRP